MKYTAGSVTLHKHHLKSTQNISIKTAVFLNLPLLMNHSTERASKPISHLAATITLPDRTGMETLPVKERFQYQEVGDESSA